ncbi:hypothetical protein VPH35_127430 [Triticum aestivum]
MRGHTKAVHMQYDERYSSYIRRARMLGFVLQFKRQSPTLVHSALTALIDRWRPETHSFHLTCGEMTVTLEDFGMITALPIEGHALTGRGNRTSGVRLKWLLENRSVCPQDVDQRTMEQYVRAYLWYLLTEVIFPDCSGDCALWMYLGFLEDSDAGYSWGSAGLDYLYRSLDDATQRTEETSGVCGFVWALSIWIWERLPVGRPERVRSRAWTDYGEEGDSARYPTVSYAWDKVKVYTGKATMLYKLFSNELDNLSDFQVNWFPYHDREWGFELNSMCEEDRLAWRCIVPLICVYAVEWHLPQRVATQFGILQHTPLGKPTDTGCSDLHWKSRKNCQSITDWGHEHQEYVKAWDERRYRKDSERRVVNWNTYRERHLKWYDDGVKYRVRLRPQWTEDDIAELEEDDSEDEAYRGRLRDLEGDFREYAPLMNRVVSGVLICFEP